MVVSEGTPAGTRPAVFARQASGLVRVAGSLDVFIFNVGLISIGLAIAFNQYLGLSSYPGARPAVGMILTGLGMATVAATIYYFSVIFPRSGGTYVFLSRTMAPGIAFVLSFVEVVTQSYFAALGASLLASLGVSPFLAVVGAMAHNQTMLNWATATASPAGKLWIGLVVLLISAALMTLGTRRYFLVQRVLFAAAAAGTVVLAVVLIFGSRARFTTNLSNLTGLGYNDVISKAEANGFTHSGFSLTSSALFITLGYFALSPVWTSASFGGEIKRVQRSQLLGIFGALVACTLVIGLFDLLAVGPIGDIFQGAVAYNSINGIAGGSTEAVVGASPFIQVLSSILAGSIPVAVIILATFALWNWFWIPALFLYSTRSMIAWSFDRVAPNRLGDVSRRFNTPVVAIWIFTGGAVVFLWLVSYGHLSLLTVGEAQVGMRMVVLLAAVIFPFRRRAMFEESPISRSRVFGVPTMVVTGVLAFAFLGLMEYLLWNDSVAAGPLIRSPLPPEFWIVGGTLVFATIWYLAVTALQRRRGIDVHLAFKQIPIE